MTKSGSGSKSGSGGGAKTGTASVPTPSGAKGPGGWPSKQQGKESGGGRDNAPPKR